MKDSGHEVRGNGLHRTACKDHCSIGTIIIIIIIIISISIMMVMTMMVVMMMMMIARKIVITAAIIAMPSRQSSSFNTPSERQ